MLIGVRHSLNEAQVRALIHDGRERCRALDDIPDADVAAVLRFSAWALSGSWNFRRGLIYIHGLS